ncbi:N-6 DNA methylase [Leptospira sp. 96542]|nr:N-6 DNA methylase [Leptospira sp. 96542]
MEDQIKKLEEYDLLFLVVKKFAEAGDMFRGVSYLEMGYIFEELIRKFTELSNETAGEHFTPREVIPHVPDAWIDHEKNKSGL